MKKFFSFSIILHLTLLTLLVSHFHLPHIEENHKSYVTISLSKGPSVSPPKFQKPPEKLKSKKIKRLLKRAEKKETQKTDKENLEANKESLASNNQEIQKEKLSYKEELYHFLKNKNHYPPIAAKLKHSGQVRVKIQINKQGQFERVLLVSPSNFKTLNDGTLSFLNKVAQFKPLPQNLNSETFEVPIVYEL